MKQVCHSCQVIIVNINDPYIRTLHPDVRYLPDWHRLIGICLLVFPRPFVADAFILAVLAEAVPISMLVLGQAKRHGRSEVLHHFLIIFLCLHNFKV